MNHVCFPDEAFFASSGFFLKCWKKGEKGIIIALFKQYKGETAQMNIRQNFNHTIAASFTGSAVQAIINNFAPLLFLTFQASYGISLDRIALLVTINFGVQLFVDLLATKFADLLGYRTCIVIAHICSAAGLIGLAVLPELFADHYIGLVAAIAIYAIGGGLIEVLVSPIVEACPTKRKAATMSLLHSFYCWGHVFVVLVSTAFFSLAGINNWKILAFCWAVIPLVNTFYFMLVPIRRPVGEAEGLSVRKLARVKVFWVMLLLMMCSGACEQAVSQWASTFAEAGLGVTKTIGDLAGPCMFAVLMGLARVFYARFSEKIALERFMFLSGVLCVISYLLISLVPSPVIGLIGCGLCGLSVGILWPGSFSIASREIPLGGTAMFALLALAGDLGCSTGPTFVGFVSGAFNDNLKVGILAAIIFPLLMLLGLFLCVILHRKKEAESV